MNVIAITRTDFEDFLANLFAEAGVPLTEVELLKDADGDYEEISIGSSVSIGAFVDKAVEICSQGHDVYISNTDAEIHYYPHKRDGELYFSSDYDRKTYHIVSPSTAT